MSLLPKTYAFFFRELLLLIVLLLSSNALTYAAPKSSLVRQLPGFNGTFPSKHYSGYVKLNTSPSKHLFYYFIESERNPTKDPVVLWLNGGPGCSSFDGFVYEHGPFKFEKGKKKGDFPILYPNPYSWSKVSNIIYLDSPSGVGFSYPWLPSSDSQTAIDSHAFLLKWFELYPEFQPNRFYISGESWAGIYVPALAAEIDKGSRNYNEATPRINLKGYIIGNGVCDFHIDGTPSYLSFAHGMALISDQLYKQAQACMGHVSGNDKCEMVWLKINKVLAGLNEYAILEPCYHGYKSEETNSSFLELGRAWPNRARVRDGKVPTWRESAQSRFHYGVKIPCFDDEVATTYLNDVRVRKAIHASPEVQSWNLCVGMDYEADLGSMVPYHKDLTSKGYYALIYSGDHDMNVPFIGTQQWTAALGYEIVEEWRPWFTDGQVAGFLQSYANNLTFLTVKGAGHTVPTYKPGECLHFYDSWLQWKKI
ncbi:OLC1v1005052C1 [Oldenlandia corymbosa var. corymbosa]|uniref:OLC1v1005052C1 n=1 Tax=Oldenlandia corymbosa var. corymbosa TaxID=529605 RepID=A0AAV1DDQ6_OLDCO|nr:OLC1v1005052C1 [Oldenlandia corymbosa var. corymbosa]